MRMYGMICKNDKLKLQHPMLSTMKMSLMIIYMLLSAGKVFKFLFILSCFLVVCFVLQHFFFISLRPAVLRLSSTRHFCLLLPSCFL